jgi:transposase
VNKGKTTSTTFTHFLMKVIRRLEAETPGSRSKVIFLLDNASFHKSAASLDFYRQAGIQVSFLAPYSFKMAAVEKLFAFVKARDLNPLLTRAHHR